MVACITLSPRSDLGNIHDGLGEKIGMCLFFLSTATASMLSALWHGWQLTLVLLSLLPFLVLITTAIAKVTRTSVKSRVFVPPPTESTLRFIPEVALVSARYWCSAAPGT